jgi:hypothetical protein
VSLLFGLALLCLLSIPLVFSIYRSNELFVVEVRKGKVRFTRGRMPQRLLNEIADVVRRPRVVSGRIRVVKEGGMPKVQAEGQFEPDHLQRLRNVVGTYEVAQIRAGGRPKAG